MADNHDPAVSDDFTRLFGDTDASSTPDSPTAQPGNEAPPQAHDEAVWAALAAAARGAAPLATASSFAALADTAWQETP